MLLQPPGNRNIPKLAVTHPSSRSRTGLGVWHVYMQGLPADSTEDSPRSPSIASTRHGISESENCERGSVDPDMVRGSATRSRSDLEAGSAGQARPFSSVYRRSQLWSCRYRMMIFPPSTSSRGSTEDPRPVIFLLSVRFLFHVELSGLGIQAGPRDNCRL